MKKLKWRWEWKPETRRRCAKHVKEHRIVGIRTRISKVGGRNNAKKDSKTFLCSDRSHLVALLPSHGMV